MGVLVLRDQLISRLISEDGFRIVTYVCLGLCALALLLRSLIRITCFRRLLPEDYLMFFALAILIARAVLVDLYLHDIYALMSVIDDKAAPSAGIISQLFHSATTYGVATLLDTIGFWTIKLNFLMFFYRLAHQIRSYLIFWWIVFCLTVACGIVAIGLLPYGCLFTNDLVKLGTYCAEASIVSNIYTRYLTNMAIDVATDLLIISFPALILWRSKISLHHKIVLSGTFALVLVTVGATIVRGSMFGGSHVFQNLQNTPHFVDMTWVLFWSFIEFVVAFIVACSISFRSFWSSKGQRTRKTYPVDKNQAGLPGSSETSRPQTIGTLSARKIRKDGRKGWSQFYDSVLETCADLEGTLVEPETRKDIPLNQWTTARVENLQPFETSDDRIPANTGGKWTQLDVGMDIERERESTKEESLSDFVHADGEGLDTERLVKPQRAYVRASPVPQDAGISKSWLE